MTLPKAPAPLLANVTVPEDLLPSAAVTEAVQVAWWPSTTVEGTHETDIVVGILPETDTVAVVVDVTVVVTDVVMVVVVGDVRVVVTDWVVVIDAVDVVVAVSVVVVGVVTVVVSVVVVGVVRVLVVVSVSVVV